MHGDGVGDGAQIEWPQMAHAMGQERILLAHDFAGHLQDRARALVETLHQPVRIVEAFGDIGLRSSSNARGVDLGVIASIHQHARQRVGIELDVPTAIGAFAHIDVWQNRLHRLGTEGEAGLRVERADFRDHVGNVFGGQVAQAGTGVEIAPRHQIEPRQDRLHGGIEPVSFLELQCQALGEIAREHPGGSKPCKTPSVASMSRRGAEAFRYLTKISAQIARFVHGIDQLRQSCAGGDKAATPSCSIR